MSSPSDKELEEQLLDAGKRLLHPPSSDDDLLSLLDQVEGCLSKVEQSPTKSMQNAFSPSLRSLIADQLLEHPNADVKVAVASCISEITRITAPEAPYDDDQMKGVFKLIVSSFGNLSDKSSQSYNKRASILDTVSKVRSCVVMLDLECDSLILEMFEHFLKEIRDYHPDNVFSSMEKIMSLVLEESEDISQELLSPILACMKKDNKDILPIARTLGERVLESSASKVKPYLVQAVNSLGIPLKDYSQVVASICELETSSAVEQSDYHATTEQTVEDSKLETSLDDAAQVDKEIAKEETSLEHVDPDIENFTKPVVSNGITQTGEDESFLDSNSKNQEETSRKEDDHHADQSESTNALGKEEFGLASQEEECKLEQATKKRGSKPSSSKSEKPSDDSRAESEKVEELLDIHKSNSKDDATSPCEEPFIEAAVSPDIVKDTKPSIEAADPSDIIRDTKPSIEAAVPSDIVKETEPFVEAAAPSDNVKDTKAHAATSSDIVKHSKAREATRSDIVKDTKALQSESENVVSPALREVLPEEGRTRKVGRPKKKGTLTKDTRSVATVISNKASETTSDPEVKPAKRSGKKPATRVSNVDISATIVSSKKESAAASDSDVKAPKQSNKQGETSGDNGSSLRRPEDNEKPGAVKAVNEKEMAELSDKDDKEVVSTPKSNTKSTKDEDQLEETPQINSKRKRTPVVEKDSDSKDGEDLVGAKIKVWWPKDKMFYEGVVDSYDSAKKRHKVLYIDGDEEVLNLKRQKWKRVACDTVADEDEGAGESSPDDTSSDVPLKKIVKANSDLSAKPGSSSSKRSGGALSSKAKGSAMKPGRKSGVDSKSKGELLKSLDGDSPSNSKLHTQKSGSKAANKSNDDDVTKSSKSKDVEITPKTKKSKQDTQNKSSGKNSKGGAKSSANGSSKVKSQSKEENEDVEDSSDSETLETVLLKSQAKGSKTKTGKKRRRGGRS